MRDIELVETQYSTDCSINGNEQLGESHRIYVESDYSRRFDYYFRINIVRALSSVLLDTVKLRESGKGPGVGAEPGVLWFFNMRIEFDKIVRG